MDAYHKYLNMLINNNKAAFSGFNINWLNPWNIDEIQNIRDTLLKTEGLKFLFNDTKPYYKSISPGCQICGEGNWSCLFINGNCNANCFYCPAPQKSDDPPISQGLTFETKESYSEYINYFGFKGASFSGGEPLLSADKVIGYLQELRKNNSPDLYIWMYTNGILANEETFQKLADSGLNEIRFDIGATNYKLDGLKKAIGIIPNITVEIPAVPEEKEQLKSLLHTLDDLGVKYLNLHQLRLTQHNAPQLTKHPYTFIHSEQPIVLESELTALELLAYAAQKHLNIGINYCSFFFKNRYQKAGYQNILNSKLKDKYEPITERGLIRIRNGAEIHYDTYKLTDKTELHPESAQTLKLKHKVYKIRRIEVEKIKLFDHTQKPTTELIESKTPEIPISDDLFWIWRHEFIEKGLRNY